MAVAGAVCITLPITATVQLFTAVVVAAAVAVEVDMKPLFTTRAAAAATLVAVARPMDAALAVETP